MQEEKRLLEEERWVRGWRKWYDEMWYVWFWVRTRGEEGRVVSVGHRRMMHGCRASPLADRSRRRAVSWCLSQGCVHREGIWCVHVRKEGERWERESL